MIRRKIGMYDVIDYINILLWIMLSGSVVMLRHGGLFIPLVLIFYLTQMVLRRHFSVSIRNTIVFLFFEGTYFLNYLIYSEQCWGPQQYFVNILLVFCAFIFAELFSENNFKNKYVNIMVALSLYSLAMHYGGMAFGWNNLAVRDGNVMAVGLHNYWAFSAGRNSGMFWEPGGYQIFLNLALMFSILGHTRDATKQEWWKRIILIVTILTTKSTVGFALMAVICVAILRTMLSNVQKQRTRAFAWILYCVAVAGIIVWLFTSETIQNKLFMENGSTTMRLGDLTGSFQLLWQIPFYGVGLNTLMKDQLVGGMGIVHNSVGIFASAINYGLLYIIIYIAILLRNAKKSRLIYTQDGYILLAVFWTLTSFTQSVFEFPIMFMFVFQFTNTRVKNAAKTIGITNG